jgi:hypothetical protein
MKREFRNHLQKYCDISNWTRMHKPRNGKKNAEAAEQLAEDILRMFLKNEPGYDGTAIMLAALAMVNSYVQKAIFFSNAFDFDTDILLKDKYEELFGGEAWMMVHHDRIQFQMEDFIRGKVNPMHNELRI